MADNYCKCCGDGTPEYIIELNQQGAPGKRGEKGDEGYSPVVDFIADNDEIRFSSTNENNITYTPNLYDYLAKNEDYIEISEWTNEEGISIDINEKHIDLTYGELDAINYLSLSKFEKVRFLSSKNIMLDSNLISYILIISHNLKICIDIFNKYKNDI